MSHDRFERRLSDALRALPRQPARAGFTRDVLTRLDAGGLGGRRRRRLGPALAAAALGLTLALALAVASGRDSPARELAAAQGELDDLRRQHQRLERELAALREQALREAPVVYLDGDESLDLVLDLTRDPPWGEGPVQPAAYGRYD